MVDNTVTEEFVIGGRRYERMSNGSLKVTPVDKPHGALYGDWTIIPESEFSEESLKETKRLLVEQMCEVVRRVADEHDELFIVNKSLNRNDTSVGWKMFFPTVNE